MAINLSGINLSGGGGAASATSGKLRLIPVDTLPDISVAKRNVIYIVPAAKPTGDNKYDEYVVIDTDNGPAWEPFGRNVTIDLSGYATKTDLEPLAKKTDLATLATKQEVKDAVVTDYSGLNNKPSINGTPLEGNLNLPVMTDEQKEIVDGITGKFTALDQKVGDLSNLQTPNKESIVAAINSGLGKRGVVSQIQTWGLDFSGYTMSNIEWSVIPQANIDLFLSAGAEFNDTDAPITKTTPWDEQVQHLPGYFYLNWLGDISYEEMQKIYNYTSYINIHTSIHWEGMRFRTHLPIVGSLFSSITAQDRALRNTTIESVNFPSLWYNWSSTKIIDCHRLQNGVIYDQYGNYSITVNCKGARNLFIRNVKVSVSFPVSKFLTNKAIIECIKTNRATTAITITLHPDAYARAMADAEILAALEANPLVSLVSA